VNVLIIDDNKTNLTLLSFLVKRVDDAKPIEFTDPLPALVWCENNDPDLVLVDYMMPEMDGLQFIQRFRKLRGKANIPIIMVTADIESHVRHSALELSANDFLTKPLDKVELIARVRNMLALRKNQLQLSNRADWLAAEVKKATQEIQARERELIYRLSRAAEFRDPETGAHLLRMANYARHIARNLGLPESEQELIQDAAPLHDIGKMGTPDHILLKPDTLNEDERQIMCRHAEIGAEILKGSASALLQAAAIIAITHHEKYDGSGYPYGLKGEEIPLHGRIIAIADVFDALTSERPYKPDWGMDRAVAYLRDNCGSHFDPLCIDAFFKEWENVLAIRAQYQDDPLT